MILKIPLYLLAGLVALPSIALAQDADAARERSRLAIDAAMERARVQSAGDPLIRKPQEPPRGLQYEELRKQQGVDPAELASQYQELTMAKRPTGPDLLVFVSTSMPIQTLRSLAMQINRAGGVMVFRGIKGGLSKKAFNEWIAILKPVAETGASIQIDPESFGRYSVTAVPTYVIAARGEGECGGTSCAADSTSLAGDVSLDYALEKFSAKGGRFGKIAEAYLSKLERK